VISILSRSVGRDGGGDSIDIDRVAPHTSPVKPNALNDKPSPHRRRHKK
jgi:hypothetical protein